MWIQQDVPPNPLISIVIEQQEEQIPPLVEYTLDEKIKLDINKCEPTHWISAEDASCLPKRVITPPTVQTAVRGAVRASNGWYPVGQCTYYVYTRRPVGQWNNATDWKWQAERDGWTVSSTPVVGAIAWQYGHVAYVESISGNNVTVSEMNYVGWNKISTRTVPANTFSYIL